MFESAVMDNLVRVNPTANVLKSLRKMLFVEQEKRHALTEDEPGETDSIYLPVKSIQKMGASIHSVARNGNADWRGTWPQMVRLRF